MSPSQKPDFQPGKPIILLAAKVNASLAATYGIPSWGAATEPLDELVNTILSQNTNDRNRDRAYQALRSRFPLWEQVRDAPEGEVIDAIRPAGLAPKKGPRIQAILKQITEERGNLDLGFLKDLPPGGSTRLAAEIQWGGAKNGSHCDAVFSGAGCVSGGYPYLSGDRQVGPAACENES